MRQNLSSDPATGGFALVISLSLMVLLTVIAFGLLTLSSISLRASNRTLAMAEARQNAAMGLVLAIGDLQKHAGQDQRATATANIAGTAAGDTLGDGTPPLNDKSVNAVPKRLSALQPGTRHWTGVFVNRSNPASIYAKTPDAINIHWLVSGNSSTYRPNNPNGGPAITPSDDDYAVAAGGGVSDPAKAVILAGEVTVGDDTDRQVVAPLVDILPDSSSKAPSGRFAWWVGDEGVKARINLDSTLVDPSHYAALGAQRRGWETVEGFESYPSPSSGPRESLPMVTDLLQAALLLPETGDKAGGASPLQRVFHSATADSRAVICDTLHGGTKIDLSAVLSGGLPTSNPVPSLNNYPIKNQNIIPSQAARSIRAPKWDAVKEFIDLHGNLSGGALVVKPADSDFTAAIAPLVTDLRILLGAKMTAKNTATGIFNINACGKIAVAIANPYPVPLTWGSGLDFEVIGQTPSGNEPSQIWNLGSATAYFASPSSNRPAVFNRAIFRVAPSTLAPGEARAYTIGGPVFRRPSAGQVVVDLVPFTSTNSADFSNCVELQNNKDIDCANGTPSMDVRESWQTTLNMLEMRLAGSSKILRRIERFEFDNGYWSPTARSFTRSEAEKVKKPFGLMLYSFQISQPGMDYRSNSMPGGYAWGQRGSTLRTFADFNLQATRYRKPIASYNPPPFFMESNDSKSLLPAVPPGGDTGMGFTRNLVASPLRWGRSAFGSEKTILFSVPDRVSSLAQLQHADLTGDDRNGSIAHQPGNAFANSYATPFVKRSLTTQRRTDYEIVGAPNHTGTNNTATNYYDISYLLNAAVWDSYFISTIPDDGPAVPLSPGLTALDESPDPGVLRDPVTAATRLMIEGAFNVNSTEKDAWKAFLGSAKHLEHPAGGDAEDAAFPRSLEQTSPNASPPTGSDEDSFSGYRRLSDDDLDALAEEMVRQVRLRGPFVTLSQFINRAVADIAGSRVPSAEVANRLMLTRSGAIQGALDESGANINLTGSKNAFSDINPNGSRSEPPDIVTLGWKQNAPSPDMDGSDTAERTHDADSSHPDWARTSTDNNFGSVASIVADQEMIRTRQYLREQGYRSTGIPGWITQADILQVIGNSITTRSDTFRIRAYGESLDSDGKPVAKAYCEAIVQRVAGYIDPANSASDRGTDLTDLNQSYGRQFKIVSFRWMSPKEI